jgi:hypothetical protein
MSRETGIAYSVLTEDFFRDFSSAVRQMPAPKMVKRRGTARILPSGAEASSNPRMVPNSKLKICQNSQFVKIQNL